MFLFNYLISFLSKKNFVYKSLPFVLNIAWSSNVPHSKNFGCKKHEILVIIIY